MKLPVIDSSRQLTASALERVSHCLPSSILPGADRQTQAGAAGSKTHALLASDSNFSLAKKLLPIQCDPETFMAERSVVYSISTGKGEIMRQGAAYGYDFDLIHGTFDGCALSSDHKSVVVWDYKTGYEVQHPDQNWQLKFYALALAKHFNVQTAHLCIIYVRDDGDHKPVYGTRESIDLDAFSVELAELVGRRNKAIQDMSADYKIGRWCKYCPSVPWCEPQREMLQSVLGAKPFPNGSETTMAQAIESYEKMRRLEETLERVKDSLRMFALGEPIGPLENGKFYKMDGSGKVRECR